MRRSKLLAPVVVLILTIGAIATVWLLVERSDARRQSQLQITGLTLSVSDLQSAPFDADPASGGSETGTLERVYADEALISRGFELSSQIGVPSNLLVAGRADLAKLEPIVETIYQIAIQPGGLAGAGVRVPKLVGSLRVTAYALSAVLAKIGRADAASSARAGTQAKLGAAGAMLLLLVAFAFFYYRSVAAREVVQRLANEKGVEARTDALTNLRNRRALADDFALAIAEPPGAPELLLIMFDLDGFKQYNDTFGHEAGDSLLHRLGGRLAAAGEAHSGSAYRTGGDEFCVLVRADPDRAEKVLDDTIAALKDSGEGWHIGCSQGAAWIPSEATTESQALRLADERMYANKAGRSSASRQVTDALLQVITEQNASLDDHVDRVAGLAGTLAAALGQPKHEVERIRVAACLHDIGKTAIPAGILNKPGPLDEKEWEFIRSHPIIGGRIVSAAPALANTAELIHSSHERVDGCGYPDGLSGPDIPLGARIIAVCDAFDAMTSDRVYRRAMGVEAALEELEDNAGIQFDAAIVDEFRREIEQQLARGGRDLVTPRVPA
ncbi:MAG TPA: HD domain-containing phosphohydrolase [Solirubrobacteraceae bacterium]